MQNALMQISNDNGAHILTKLKFPYQVCTAFMEKQRDKDN